MSTSTSPVGQLPSIDPSTLLWPIRAVAFWAAIIMPFVSVGLVANGVGADPATLGSLLAANVGAFVLGHGYRR